MLYILDKYKIKDGIIRQDDLEINILDNKAIYLQDKRIIVGAESSILTAITEEEKQLLIEESNNQNDTNINKSLYFTAGYYHLADFVVQRIK